MGTISNRHIQSLVLGVAHLLNGYSRFRVVVVVVVVVVVGGGGGGGVGVGVVAVDVGVVGVDVGVRFGVGAVIGDGVVGVRFGAGVSVLLFCLAWAVACIQGRWRR